MRNYPPLLVAAGHEFVPGATLVQSKVLVLTLIDLP